MRNVMLAAVAVWILSVAAERGNGRAVNPAAIMTDMRAAPRFQVKILRDLIADSELSSAVAELSTSKAVDAASGLVYDPLVLKVGRTWQMLCQVPRVSEEEDEDKEGDEGDFEEKDEEYEEEEEESESADVVAERGLALLEPLRERCLTYAGGWWTFEYCHGQHVRQFHELAPEKVIEFRLGAHAQRQELGSGATTLVRRVGRSRYLAQVWGGGTLCDMTREPRSVEIQFHCDPHGPERIAMVEEVEVCHYAMVVNSPRLCADPLFYDTAASTIYDITCRQVLSDADYAEAMAAGDAIGEADDDDDDDDLPLAEVAAAKRGGEENKRREERRSEERGEKNGEAKKGEKKSEKKGSAQVVVSLNDPELPHLSKDGQEMLRKLMAAAYDTPQLRVRFADQ